MPCFHPLQAFNLGYKPNGKINLSFTVPEYAKGTNFSFPIMSVPCGRCCGCRLERSRQWAVRCMHEAALYGLKNCFITLTFNDEAIAKHLPPGGGLSVKPWQDFMKRLRKKYGPGIRYFHCGEYGENFGRPHYHACLFNHTFDDRYLWKVVKKEKLYRSPSLESLWTDKDGLSLGHSTVGTVTFNSAAYVARYIMKKINGKDAEEHYALFDVDDDAVIHDRYQLKPEYITMSKQAGGIGKGFFDKFYTDIYPSDKVLINNKVTKPPRYYDTLYELMEPHEFEKLKFMRSKNGEARAWDNTPERLAVRETICLSKIEKLQRSL